MPDASDETAPGPDDRWWERSAPPADAGGPPAPPTPAPGPTYAPPSAAGPTTTWPPPDQPRWAPQPQWVSAGQDRWAGQPAAPGYWTAPGAGQWGGPPGSNWASTGQGAPPLTHPGPPTAPWGTGGPWNPPPAPPGSWSGGSWQPWTPPPARPPRSPEEVRRLRRRGLIFAIVLVLALGVGIGIGAAVAPTNPKTSSTSAMTLVTKAVAAATSAKTYHYLQFSTEDGTPFDITGDATPSGGRQVITQKGASGYDDYDLRLVKGVVYFRGNLPAVLDQLGVTTATGTSVSGEWVKIVKGERPYKQFAEGIATASNIKQINSTFVARTTQAMPGSKPATTRIVGGLYAGKGKAAVGKAAMVVQSANSLPQSLNGEVTDGSEVSLRITWTFTHFGEKVSVPAPSGAVAFSTLKTHATTATRTGSKKPSTGTGTGTSTSAGSTTSSVR